MDLSSIPYKFEYPWASGATPVTYVTDPIPPTSASPAASQLLGWPPATANPSGTPPSIADFNGVFKYCTEWTQWAQAGGPIRYDATFSSWIGGYPQGALIASTTVGQYWVNLADNNTTNPDGGSPANWQNLFTGLTPLSAFVNSVGPYTTSGYANFPAGIIIQVGFATVPGGAGSVAVTFAEAFPNNVMAITLGSDVVSANFHTFASQSNAGFVLSAWTAGGGVPGTVQSASYIAFGY
jgi:hypothetical protein